MPMTSYLTRTVPEGSAESVRKRRFPARFPISKLEISVLRMRYLKRALPGVQRSTSSFSALKHNCQVNAHAQQKKPARFGWEDFNGDFQISRKISRRFPRFHEGGFPRRFQARCTRFPQVAAPRPSLHRASTDAVIYNICLSSSVERLFVLCNPEIRISSLSPAGT